jgi:polysaccharide export outer membrane protein
VKKHVVRPGALALVVMGIASMASAQTPPPVPALPQTPTNGVPAPPTRVTPPPDYVIGPEDVVAVMFWRDQEMSGDYVVRPDGVITLPLLSDVMAAGLTPEQLRDSLTKEATKFLEDPNVTVGIKAINSRKVHITGMVSKPGVYPLTAPTTVLQLIATAGGLQEFADSKKIIIVRMENGRQVAHKFNYNDVKKGKNLAQNIQLKPGDSIIVP